MLVRLDFCCNDPDNGSPSGHVCAIQMGGAVFELEANDERGPVFREFADRRVRIGRRTFPFVRAKGWFGNWCWDAFWFDIDVAVDLLDWLHRQRRFDCTCGDEELFDLWGDERTWSRQGLRYELHTASLAEKRERIG